MTHSATLLQRVARNLPRGTHAHWLLRLPLALVLLNQGYNKFPLSDAMAEGFGVPYFMWIMAAVGEVAVGLLLIIGGFLRGPLGDLTTRIAGLGTAAIIAGVIYVAYWAPPIEILLFNQFHVLLLAGGLYLALTGKPSARRVVMAEAY